MMIAVTICSTRSYSYALLAQARRIQACISQGGLREGRVILVGDESEELRQTEQFYRSILPEAWGVDLLPGKYEDGLPNYKNEAQLVIARMRSAAFDRARQIGADLCWSLDSDVLPQPNALLVMRQMLEFDDGFYSVSTCPYPSQGGGDFLGGRGTPENPILGDFGDDERIIPEELRARMQAHRERMAELKGRLDEAWLKEFREIGDEVKKCPPIGDVFFCNSQSRVESMARMLADVLAKTLPKGSELIDKIVAAWRDEHKEATGFRRRGWLSAAYPAIGLGAVVPSDWCGFGCTLMSKRALGLAQFDGYDGAGTEDLYVVWKRWHRVGLRLNVIPHSPCDHVIRDPEDKTKFILCQAYHETRDPECVGHLRIERRPWYQQADGEIFAPS